MKLAPFTSKISQFAKDDLGATTVDWVVLCGAIVSIGIATVAAITTNLEEGAVGLETSISNGIQYNLRETLGGDDG